MNECTKVEQCHQSQDVITRVQDEISNCDLSSCDRSSRVSIKVLSDRLVFHFADPMDPIIRSLSTALQFVPDAQRFVVYDSTVYLFKYTKTYGWSCSRGLLNRVCSLLSSMGVAYDLGNYTLYRGYLWQRVIRSRLHSVQYKFEPRDYQFESAEQAILHRRGVLKLATNAGKTLIAAMILKFFSNLPALVLCGSKKLARQLQTELSNFMCESVGLVTGDQKNTDCRVVVGLPNSLMTMPSLLDQARVLIVDEVHHAAANSTAKVIKQTKNTRVRIGLSATPFDRTDKKNLINEALIGPVLYEVKSSELVDRGISAKPRIKFLRVQSRQIDISGRMFARLYNAGIVENMVRNDLICDLVCHHVKKGMRVFITVREIDHGEQLKRSLMKHVKVGFVYGEQIPEIQEQIQTSFEQGQLDVLIGSPVYGEGVDFNVAVDVYIPAEGMKSTIRVLQSLGRSMRKGNREFTVYDFIDECNGILYRHSKDREKLFRHEGYDVEIIKDSKSVFS